MRAFNISLEIETQSSEIRCNRRFVGRAFVQTLEDIIQFPGVIVFAIKPAKRVECLASQGRIFCDAQPQVLGFFLQIPFRSETREDKFALNLVVCRLFCAAPKFVGFARRVFS